MALIQLAPGMILLGIKPKMNKKAKKFSCRLSQGFTLIELLIYLAIVSIVINTLIILAINLIGLGSKSNRQGDVQSATQFISGKIKYEVRNASDINVSSSDFGLNLAANPGRKISLAESGASNPVVLDVLNGQARISRGGAVPILLNPAGTAVSDLSFTNLSSGDGLTKQLKFTLTIIASNPSPGNVYETLTVESSAELRSHP